MLLLYCRLAVLVSPFYSVAVLIVFLVQCRRSSLSPFWRLRFGVLPFWFVAVLTTDHSAMLPRRSYSEFTSRVRSLGNKTTAVSELIDD